MIFKQLYANETSSEIQRESHTRPSISGYFYRHTVHKNTPITFASSAFRHFWMFPNRYYSAVSAREKITIYIMLLTSSYIVREVCYHIPR